MGQLLSHPIEEKTIESQSHTSLAYCIGSMQGYRMTMEDAHDVKINEDETVATFGVFDGHGGSTCSEYLSGHLTKLIFKTINHHRRHAPPSIDGNVLPLQEYLRIIKDCFFKVDHDLSTIPHLLNCGSTAITATIIKDKYIIVANTGDSRCILSVNGQPKTLSFDHKPILMNERIRVENSNGYVSSNRINEVLALSRAFGDFKFKAPYIDNIKNKYMAQNTKYLEHGQAHLPPELTQVTVEPELMVYDLQQKTPEFMVIACDGIWDCYKNSKVIRLIRDKLALGWKLNKIVEFVLSDCLSMANNYTGIGFDNMTLIIVAIHTNGNIDDWYDKIKEKVLKEKKIT